MDQRQSQSEGDDIYRIEYVERLFDEMAGSYGRVNVLTSFGFSRRWRQQAVDLARLRPGMIVADFMCGMGECWHWAAKGLDGRGQLVALDISRGMLRGAEKACRSLPDSLTARLVQESALENSLEDASVDSVICGFGVKTLTDEEIELLARETRRVLKPGGTFSFVEVSVPDKTPMLRSIYMFYLKNVIPRIGQLLLGNPQNYRMLGIYTERFGNCHKLAEALRGEHLQATYHDFFLGCATGVSGTKPA